MGQLGHHSSPPSPPGGFIAVLVLGATLVGLAAVSPPATLVVLRSGLFAAGIVVGATGLGLVAIRSLRLPACPGRWQLLGAVGLGLGLLSLLVLLLGAAGVLHRSVWFTALALFVVGGASCSLQQTGILRRPRGPGVAEARSRTGGEVQRPRGTPLRSVHDAKAKSAAASVKAWPQEGAEVGEARMRWLWAGIVVFAILAALAATMPPGTIWPEEGNGYDVLEYHLGVPREYLEAGRISYLPHNIYANLPLNVEMLYLLTMVLHGEALAAAFTANLLNLLLGVIAVAAIWLGGREYGRGPGIIAGIAAGSCPFLAYLCGLAYNENGMLAFAALAAAAVLRAERLPPEQRGHWWVLAGLFCGFSCGCKYTAVPMVFLPLAVAATWGIFHATPRRPGQLVGFVVAAAAAFAPWLIKNGVATGNPVFPLARKVLHEREGIWNDDGASRWQEGHLPAPEDRRFSRRLTRLGGEVLYSKLYGPLPLLALVLGCVASVNRPRGDKGRPASCNGAGLRACWLMLLIGAATWLAFTHLAGRFAVVMIVPLSLMVGRAWGMRLRPAAKAVGIAVLAAALAVNAWTGAGFFKSGDVSLLKADFFGRMDLVTDGHWPGHQHLPRLNEALSRGERVLMVADARRLYLDEGVDYCVVFNRNPFAEAAADLSPQALIDWLRDRQYRYVYVDWAEMHRLRSTRYGFWRSIDAALFARLGEVGLEAVEHFQITGRQNPYATLFGIASDGGR